MEVGDRKRLINCDFLNARAFTKMPNKAQLLYLEMFARADDLGFVNSTDDIIDKLTNNDIANNVECETLTNSDYTSMLVELLHLGYLFEFTDRHNNRVHLIRHWFTHNRYKQGLETNYYKYLALVELTEGCYELKKKNDIKEKNLKQIKLKQINVNGNETTKEEWDNLMKELEELEPRKEEDDNEICSEN